MQQKGVHHDYWTPIHRIIDTNIDLNIGVDVRNRELATNISNININIWINININDPIIGQDELR